jgi:hypothetical protein
VSVHRWSRDPTIRHGTDSTQLKYRIIRTKTVNSGTKGLVGSIPRESASASGSGSGSHSICDEGGRVDMFVFGCSRDMRIKMCRYLFGLMIHGEDLIS